jgi:hypothetical protein
MGRAWVSREIHNEVQHRIWVHQQVGPTLSLTSHCHKACQHDLQAPEETC